MSIRIESTEATGLLGRPDLRGECRIAPDDEKVRLKALSTENRHLRYCLDAMTREGFRMHTSGVEYELFCRIHEDLIRLAKADEEAHRVLVEVVADALICRCIRHLAIHSE